MRRLTRSTLALLPLLSALASQPSAMATPRYKHLSQPRSSLSAKNAAQLEATVRTLIDGYEPLDVEHGIAQLGAPAADVLLRIIRQANTPELIRLRAIEALGYVPTPAGQDFLRETVARIGTTDDERVFTLAAALRALGGFGASELPSVSLFLEHVSPIVREAAAAGMAQMRSDSVLPALQRRLAVERDSGVKETLNNAISRLAAAPSPSQGVKR
ncbi:MAG: HEAT repeat domain-containing protein [Myxococcales bacterium]|nr:HEAT repeat domain-containing protein [Myxococcales bacterium]